MRAVKNFLLATLVFLLAMPTEYRGIIFEIPGTGGSQEIEKPC